MLKALTISSALPFFFYPYLWLFLGNCENRTEQNVTQMLSQQQCLPCHLQGSLRVTGRFSLLCLCDLSVYPMSAIGMILSLRKRLNWGTNNSAKTCLLRVLDHMTREAPLQGSALLYDQQVFPFISYDTPHSLAFINCTN